MHNILPALYDENNIKFMKFTFVKALERSGKKVRPRYVGLRPFKNLLEKLNKVKVVFFCLKRLKIGTKIKKKTVSMINKEKRRSNSKEG